MKFAIIFLGFLLAYCFAAAEPTLNKADSENDQVAEVLNLMKSGYYQQALTQTQSWLQQNDYMNLAKRDNNDMLANLLYTVKESGIVDTVLRDTLKIELARQTVQEVAVRLFQQGIVPWRRFLDAVTSSGLLVEPTTNIMKDIEARQGLVQLLADLTTLLISNGLMSLGDFFGLLRPAMDRANNPPPAMDNTNPSKDFDFSDNPHITEDQNPSNEPNPPKDSIPDEMQVQ